MPAHRQLSGAAGGAWKSPVCGKSTGALQHWEGLSQVKVSAGVVAEASGCDRKLKAEARKALLLYKGFSEIASKFFQIEDGILLAKLFCFFFFFHCAN